MIHHCGGEGSCTSANYSLRVFFVSLNFGISSNTSNYYTVGVAKEIVSGVNLYAEGQLSDLDSGTDTQSWSLGAKYSF